MLFKEMSSPVATALSTPGSSPTETTLNPRLSKQSFPTSPNKVLPSIYRSNEGSQQPQWVTQVMTYNTPVISVWFAVMALNLLGLILLW